jgi:uncharacterized RDD family membrane protein YckC
MTQSTITEADFAGLWPRLGAAVYDAFLLVGLFFLATALVAPFMPDDHVSTGATWFQAYLLLVMYGFYGWFWTHGGQTLGMRAWRLRLVSQDGGNVGWPRAFLRFAIGGLAWLSVIGLLACLRNGIALHDQFSGTRVLWLPKN